MLLEDLAVGLEEFVEGHEGFWDTLSVNGEVAHEFISHYYPGVLEAMRTRWIAPQIITTNRIDSVDDPGKNALIARTRAGEELLAAAAADGALKVMLPMVTQTGAG